MDNPGSVFAWADRNLQAQFGMAYHPPAPLGKQLILVQMGDDPADYSGRVHWMNENGIALLPVSPLSAIQHWEGRIAIAGYVDRLHVRQLNDAEILIAEVVGCPLPLDYHNLASAADLRDGRLSMVRERASIGADDPEYNYPVLIDPESSFAMLAQDALVSGLAVDVIGTLADQSDMTALDCGLLLHPQSFTVFSSAG